MIVGAFDDAYILGLSLNVSPPICNVGLRTNHLKLNSACLFVFLGQQFNQCSGTGSGAEEARPPCNDNVMISAQLDEWHGARSGIATQNSSCARSGTRNHNVIASINESLVSLLSSTARNRQRPHCWCGLFRGRDGYIRQPVPPSF